MAIVSWSEELSVGVRSVDNQQTVLIEFFNNLYDTMLKGKARVAAGSLLDFLADWLTSHTQHQHRA